MYDIVSKIQFKGKYTITRFYNLKLRVTKKLVSYFYSQQSMIVQSLINAGKTAILNVVDDAKCSDYRLTPSFIFHYCKVKHHFTRK